MITIFSNVILFAILLSALTIGISNAANTGGLLFPFRAWILSKKLRSEFEFEALDESWTKQTIFQRTIIADCQSTDEKRQAAQTELQRIATERAIAKTRLEKAIDWRKPIITCIICMPSFWGLLLNLCLWFPISPIEFVLAVCAASTLNVFYVKKIN